ncbi:hypothetical protein CRENBAI_014674 [Crenichthys baileyi]|uniref:Uncharacterized protein n=1 Tax=Crenichthys baileyi TaxID=28760 RepID=A0AAV9RRS3_9TELE
MAGTGALSRRKTQLNDEGDSFSQALDFGQSGILHIDVRQRLGMTSKMVPVTRAAGPGAAGGTHRTPPRCLLTHTLTTSGFTISGWLLSFRDAYCCPLICI